MCAKHPKKQELSQAGVVIFTAKDANCYRVSQLVNNVRKLHFGMKVFAICVLVFAKAFSAFAGIPTLEELSSHLFTNAPALSKNSDDIQPGTVRRMDWPRADATEMMAR
jgi:hypothetical protein